MLIEKILTDKEVQEVLNIIKKEEWTAGYTNAGKYHKDNKELKNSKAAELVTNKIINCDIVKNYGFFKHMLPVRFNWYEDSGKYANHVDFFQQEGIRTDWSMTLFLTNDYEGGELVVEDQEVKPEAGSLVLYNSGQIHRVNPVTKGKRIAAISWAQSYIEDAHERLIVARVGEAIKKVEGRDEETVNLSFVYSNLMRKWCA